MKRKEVETMNKVYTTLVETLSTSSVILSIIISINIIPPIDCLAQCCASSRILDSSHIYILHLSALIMLKCWHQPLIAGKTESAQWQPWLWEITAQPSWQLYDCGSDRPCALELISCPGHILPCCSTKLKSNRTHTLPWRYHWAFSALGETSTIILSMFQTPDDSGVYF